MAFKDKKEMYSYNNEFNRGNYDRINLMTPKGRKEQIKEAAKLAGISVNAWINEAIDEKL